MQKLADRLKTLRMRNIDYYVKAFGKLEKTDESTFNNAAAYFGCAWMLYRKMYLYAVIAFTCQWILTYALSFIGQKITFFSDAQTGSYIGTIVATLICIRLFGVYGNKLYYNVVKKRVSENYYLADGYQVTTLPLAVCFALAHTFFIPLILLLLITLYFHYSDSSLIAIKETQKASSETISIETLKLYLNKKNLPSNVDKTPTYLALLLIAVSGLFTGTTLLFKLEPAITAIISVLFPVLV